MRRRNQEQHLFVSKDQLEGSRSSPPTQTSALAGPPQPPPGLLVLLAVLLRTQAKPSGGGAATPEPTETGRLTCRSELLLSSHCSFCSSRREGQQKSLGPSVGGTEEERSQHTAPEGGRGGLYLPACCPPGRRRTSPSAPAPASPCRRTSRSSGQVWMIKPNLILAHPPPCTCSCSSRSSSSSSELLSLSWGSCCHGRPVTEILSSS